MSETTFKLGCLPPRSESTAPRLKLARFLAATTLPPTPQVVDWIGKVNGWPLYLNDRFGTCVWAMAGHAIEAATTYGQGATVKVSDADILKGYRDVTGFNPNDPATDRGTVIQDALNYWRKTGIGGHKILAFAQVNHRNTDEVAAALNLFGHLMVGIDFPRSAMAQFNRRQPWDVVGNDGGSDGGHAVDLGYNAQTGALQVVTWGRPQPLTLRWWTRYVREAWVVVQPEWLTAAGHSPAGLDLYGLGDALHQLTGDPNPSPTPGPTPTPAHDPADTALAAAVNDWAGQPHSGTARQVARALNTWRTAKGL